jgi:hypothetical protein
VEHKGLDPFLATLATRNPKSGRIRYARGACLRAAGNEIDAIHLFVEAARLEPACAANCIEQLQAMLATSHHPGKVRRALAETQLVNGEIDNGVATLREYLAEKPENSREVIMLVRPFMDPAHGLNACAWLALEQALSLEGPALVLELMRPMQARGEGAELFAWLEEHPLPLPPPELVIFHASLAIESKQFERAADMLEDVCAASPQDVPGVLAMIDRHRAADFAIERLYLKYAPKQEKTAVAASTEEDFQTFEPGEFKLETSARAPAAPVSPSPSNEKTKPRFNSSPFSSPGAKADTPERAAARKSFIDRGELSLDDDGPNPRAGEPASMFAATSIDITEEHVTNVGQKLYETGASAFFHIDEETVAAASETTPAHNGNQAESGTEAVSTDAATPARAHAASAAPEVTATPVAPAKPAATPTPAASAAETPATAAPKEVLGLSYSDAGLDYYSNGIVASDAMIEANPGLVRRFC